MQKGRAVDLKNRNIIESFNNAANGIVYAIVKEMNMKIHITIAILVVIASMFFNLDRIELIILLLTVALVFVCELINTAIEVAVDMVIDIYHPKVKIVKDIAAGAVLVSAVVSVLVAYMLFFDRMRPYTEMLILKISRSPAHITFIIITLTLIFVLIAKAYTKKGTLFSGGVVSGHSALAFSLATAVAFMTKDFILTTISLLLGIMVAQSRVEGKIHTPFEVFFGGVLGVLVTTLIFQIFVR